MNYIYDIVLNFNKDYFCFYEWNKKDNIINIKKIPLFVVDNNTFNMMKYDKIVVDSSFIELIKEKTYTYSKNKIGSACLISNCKEVIGVLFDNKGNLVKRSSLLIDEEEEVLDEILNDDIYNINIVSSKKIRREDINRIEREKKLFLNKYIKRENNIINLKYLYYDYFEKEEDNNIIIKKSLLNEINGNWNDRLNSFYETVKIFNKINN